MTNGTEIKTKKGMPKWLWVIIGIFVLIIIIFVVSRGEKKETKPEVTSPIQKEITQPVQPEIEEETEDQKEPPTTQKEVVFSAIVYEQTYIKELISYLDTEKDLETIKKLQSLYDLLGNLEPEIGAGLDMIFQIEGKIAKNEELLDEMRQTDPVFRRQVVLTVLLHSLEAFYSDVEVANSCLKSAVTEKEKKKCIEQLPG